MTANKITLKNNKASFDAILRRASHPTCNILFAAGSGGNPERHLPLLNSLVECGCTVIAPYFEPIISPTPSAEELHLRADSLRTSLDFIDDSNLPCIGIGHSIGASLLVALTCGQMWMLTGQALSIAKDERLRKLVLFTPPTGFFQAPKALDKIRTPLQIWAGSLDVITTPQQVEFLKKAAPPQVSTNFQIVAGAGHFSFMNTLPPNIIDPMTDREKFLDKLTSDVCQFVIS